MKILIEIYMEMKELKLVRTEASFSVNWLHKSERYYSMIKHSQREASIDALCTLEACLKDAAKRMDFDGSGKTHTTLCCVTGMADRLAERIRVLALTRSPRRRNRTSPFVEQI